MPPQTDPTTDEAQPSSPGAATRQLVEQLFTRISEVSTLPQLAVQIIALVEDPTGEVLGGGTAAR